MASYKDISKSDFDIIVSIDSCNNNQTILQGKSLSGLFKIVVYKV